MKKYNKLVRDNIPLKIVNSGGEYKAHVAGDTEYWEKLKQKLSEEVEEFNNARTPKEREEEFADILEVLDAMFDHLELSEKYIRYVQKKKRDKKGSFKKRIILDEATEP